MAAPGIDLIVLRCADLAEAEAFYAGLGLTLVAEKHGDGPDHWSCQLGDVVLELYPLASRSRSRSTSGLRLGLVVADLAGALATVEPNGGRILRPGAEPENPTEAVVRDPDGHTLALRQQ